MKYSLDPGAYDLERAHPTDAGADIRSPIDIIVPARGSAVIDTGVHVQIEHAAGFLKSKSGLNINHDIVSEGVIDDGYTGSVKVKLYNHGDEDYHVHRGDKITQLVVMEIRFELLEKVERIEGKERGDHGFGSTGR